MKRTRAAAGAGRALHALAIALAVCSPGRAQPLAPPGVIVPGSGANQPLERALAEQKKAFEQRQECIARNGAAQRLYVATQELIEIRDNRKAVERQLDLTPAMRAEYPGGYADLLRAAFARYRAAGGTADAPASIAPAIEPCPAKAKFAPLQAPQGRSPVGETRELPQPPRAAP